MLPSPNGSTIARDGSLRPAVEELWGAGAVLAKVSSAVGHSGQPRSKQTGSKQTGSKQTGPWSGEGLVIGARRPARLTSPTGGAVSCAAGKRVDGGQHLRCLPDAVAVCVGRTPGAGTEMHAASMAEYRCSRHD